LYLPFFGTLGHSRNTENENLCNFAKYPAFNFSSYFHQQKNINRLSVHLGFDPKSGEDSTAVLGVQNFISSKGKK
jgi:hypothetical protein